VSREIVSNMPTGESPWAKKSGNNDAGNNDSDNGQQEMGRPEMLTWEAPRAGTRVKTVLSAGGVVALPTDTVYGLAGLASRRDALEKVFFLKRRPEGIEVPVLVAGLEQAEQYGVVVGELARKLAFRFWPGGLTLVVKLSLDAPIFAGGEGTSVGIRQPADDRVLALCEEVGPLIGTSANRHGEPPATSAQEVLASFRGARELELIVDGGIRDGAPSTVVDCRGEVPIVLRQGSVRVPEH
jgi:L-threonylcarbamoyladenylate synthase